MTPLSRKEVPDTLGIWVGGMNSYLGELFHYKIRLQEGGLCE